MSCNVTRQYCLLPSYPSILPFNSTLLSFPSILPFYPSLTTSYGLTIALYMFLYTPLPPTPPPAVLQVLRARLALNGACVDRPRPDGPIPIGKGPGEYLVHSDRHFHRSNSTTIPIHHYSDSGIPNGIGKGEGSNSESYHSSAGLIALAPHRGSKVLDRLLGSDDEEEGETQTQTQSLKAPVAQGRIETRPVAQGRIERIETRNEVSVSWVRAALGGHVPAFMHACFHAR